MLPDGSAARAQSDHARPATALEKVLRAFSVITMVLTVPQVWVVWVDREVGGVSLISWGAYLVSACLWFVYGIQKRDKTIYLACIGWIIMDAAIVIGIIIHR